jgi:hypothetical protein
MLLAMSIFDGNTNLPIMSYANSLWILPLLTLTTSLVAVARETSATLPLNLGAEYTGSLTPSASNPQGEVCYRLTVKSDTRLTLNLKTSGSGIVKFAVYGKDKSLRFFHNESPSTNANPASSKLNFRVINEASQLCLTTSNSQRSQQYRFTVSAQPIRTAKSRLKLRSVASKPVTTASKPVTAPKPRRTVEPSFTPPAPPVIPPIPTTPIVPPNPTVANSATMPVVTGVSNISTDSPKPIAPTIATVELSPVGAPYCYVGTWQVSDLRGYWLPTIQSFTQAQITNPKMLGYAKVTFTRDGYAIFEAIDLDQQYTLKSKGTGAKVDKISVNLAGRSSARFQSNQDGKITFNSQDYRRLTSKLNLGDSLKLTGDRLFTFFGDKDVPTVNSSYKCLDRDNLTIKVPLPNSEKLIPISFKRVN